MITFRLSSAQVDAPNGDTYMEIPAQLKPSGDNSTLSYMLDGVQHDVVIVSGWPVGRRGFGMTDVDGLEWGVKRLGGCGCGGG